MLKTTCSLAANCLWDILGKSITNSTQPWEMQINRAPLYWYLFNLIQVSYFILNNCWHNIQRKTIVAKRCRNKLNLSIKFRFRAYNSCLMCQDLNFLFSGTERIPMSRKTSKYKFTIYWSDIIRRSHFLLLYIHKCIFFVSFLNKVRGVIY